MLQTSEYGNNRIQYDVCHVLPVKRSVTAHACQNVSDLNECLSHVL